jgi:serine/threonine-protein kinase
MIDGRGRVRIMDFGLAALASEMGSEQAIVGTPAYMAPEQLAGKGATVRSDMYSLGLVLYEIYTGKKAFTATTLAELRQQKETHTPRAISELREGMDPVVERLIRRCMERDPNARPSSVAQLALALPGGDPLAAALAAGETPSPDMVAAAGDTGAMSPRTAVAWLAVALVGLMATLFAGHLNSALTRLPLDDSPDVSGFKARTMLGRLGYPNAPVDWARGYQWDTGYADWVEARDTSQGRWKDLASGHLLLRFWYRTAPSNMVPMRFLGGRLLAFEQCRVGVIKPAVERMRREVAQVLLIQLAQGADQRARLLHDVGGEGVRLVFVTPRPPVRHRRKPERDHARQEAEQEQRGDDAARLEARLARTSR